MTARVRSKAAGQPSVAVSQAVAGKRPNKYRNVPTVVDGVEFASKREAARFGELRIMERAGLISQLRRQPRFPLEVNGQVVAVYIGDAVYILDGKEVVEDVKSPATRKNPVYRLKKRLMAALYGVEIREVA